MVGKFPSRQRCVAVLWLCLAAVTTPADERPLPDLDAFLREVRARLHTDGQRQYGYEYVETRRRETLDPSGRVTSASVTVLESIPGLPGQPRWERLLVRDGTPVPAGELRRQDEARRREIEADRRHLARQTGEARARQEREWAAQRQEIADTLDDVFRVYDIRMLEREAIDGHDTIVLSLTPRQGVEPCSSDGRWFEHFKGRAWISEAEHELVRLDVEAIGDVGLALGLLARIHTGTVASFERRPVGGGAWLPVKTTYSMSGRFWLLRRVRERITSEFTKYRKTDVRGYVD